MVRAYLDASGKSSDPVVVVAGFLGWQENFAEFEERWKAFLSEFGLDHFHATEFWAKQSRPFRNWSDAHHLKARHDICRILSETGPPFGISVALNVEVFNQWRSNLDHYYPSDPYYFCLDRVLNTLIYATGSKDDEGILIYCDQEKEHESMGSDLAQWHEARLRNDPSLATNPVEAQRDVSILYGPKRTHISMQLADIFANDTFKMVRDYLNSGVYREQQFTRCLKTFPKRKIFTYFYEKKYHFTIDYHLRLQRRI
ncbi:DUF3800 domain-containing protein [Rhizobiales bacterium]|uniref:DUF3800 domain-containing protein n=1 Tax=Hongsoonwoonella zoysiae TaxID=2821844 RepID=UPI00155FC5B9|nr:DUF3800 domain-containing protein [Hongsoonwoonella zoysiae]NRG19402.1 DUF3800 domain-containing protein [Hongsoonwoonella zoysiae]